MPSDEAERELFAARHNCAVCCGLLVTPWDPNLGQTVVVCAHDRSHRGYITPDEALYRQFPHIREGQEAFERHRRAVQGNALPPSGDAGEGIVCPGAGFSPPSTTGA